MTGATAETTTTAALGRAFKQVRQIDRGRVSARAGVVAAIPVAGMLALGTLLDSPTAAVTMGVGAMLVGVAWRAGDGPLVPPIGTMTGAALVLALATLAGTLTGRWPWLHLAVLAVFCLVAGSATALGRAGTVIGNQSLIALIVFGRFPEGVGEAFAGAGLVFAGGMAQTLFAFVVAVPLAWRRQRDAVASAYRELASYAGAVLASSTTAAVALDSAEALLSAPALFAHRERSALSDLIDEGRRLRLELIALGATLRQEHRADETGDPLRQEVSATLTQVVTVLSLVAVVAGGDRDSASALAAAATRLRSWRTERPPLSSTRVDERLAALLGQVSAAARLVGELEPTSSSPGPLAGAVAERSLEPLLPGHPSLGSRREFSQLLAGMRRIRESATLQSAAGRHAIRLAVVVAGTELLVQRVALPRAYWAVVAAAMVLRPGFGATFTRGAERMLGTCAGVVIATLIAVALDPSGWGVVAVVGILSCCTYAVFSASFTAGVAGLTGIVVFLLHAVSPDSAQTALDRGIDTLIGGSIGLAAYLLWPTWSSMSVGPLLGKLADAQRAYVRVVLALLVSGDQLDAGTLRPLARNARIAWTDAQTAVDLARSEPRHDHVDPQQMQATLGALRRVVHGAHILRLDAEDPPERRSLPELEPLCVAVDDGLGLVARELNEHDVDEAMPPLRHLYRGLRWNDADPYLELLRPDLDELVDAINTAAASAGLEVA